MAWLLKPVWVLRDTSVSNLVIPTLLNAWRSSSQLCHGFPLGQSQILTLGGVLFQRLVTSHSLVRAFVPRHYVHFFPQAEPHGTSTLYFLYCRNVFEQILDITLVLTQEVIFFGCHYFSSLSFLDLAFHSDKEPFLVLYCNRVALCHPAIIFSMWFFFHLNQDI